MGYPILLVRGEKRGREGEKRERGKQGRERGRGRGGEGEEEGGGKERSGEERGTWVKQWLCPSHQKVVLSTAQGVYRMHYIAQGAYCYLGIGEDEFPGGIDMLGTLLLHLHNQVSVLT